MPRRKKTYSPKTKDTLTRIWNDIRQAYNIDMKKLNTKEKMLDFVAKFDAETGSHAYSYFRSVPNAFEMIGGKSPYSGELKSLIDRRTDSGYKGNTSGIRRIVEEGRIRNTTVIVNKTKTGYTFYGKRGGYLGEYKQKSRKFVRPKKKLSAKVQRKSKDRHNKGKKTDKRTR